MREGPGPLSGAFSCNRPRRRRLAVRRGGPSWSLEPTIVLSRCEDRPPYLRVSNGEALGTTGRAGAGVVSIAAIGYLPAPRALSGCYERGIRGGVGPIAVDVHLLCKRWCASA